MGELRRPQAREKPAAGQGSSFLVRLRPAAKGSWQGQITHVQSGQAAYFKDLEEMLGFISDRLGDRSHVQSPTG